MKLELPQVTLLGIDCVNVERLQAAMNVSEKGIEFGAVKLLTSLSTEDKRLTKISHIGSVEDFSSFCIQELHKYVETDYVLLVQYDGFILNPESWTSEFLMYDYTGAPCSWKKGFWTVGNGGFCLRSKKFLETSARLANNGELPKLHPEDIALCVWYRDLLEKEGIVFAPVDLGMKFSVQEDYGVYDKPFGFHGLFGKNMDELMKNYPDFPVHYFIPRRKGKMIEKIKEIFENKAVEGYVLETSEYSDIKIIFKEKDFKEAWEKRLEYYSQLGDVADVTKSSQGMSSLVTYKTKAGLIKINFSFYSELEPSNAKEGKKLW